MKKSLKKSEAPGIKVSGEGEWKVKVHGKSRRRKWIKIHVAVDPKTREILCLELTDGHTADCKVGPKLVQRCLKTANEYLGDGSYDIARCRKAIQKRGAKALIPPKKNGKWRPDKTERNQAISERRGLGLDEIGTSLWGKLTGYSRRALVETTFSRMKGLFGPVFFSRKRERQIVEGHLKCLMMNHMMRVES